ncbi:MAG: hypothetical protein ABSF35_23695, partial [Polyangia bacterium]
SAHQNAPQDHPSDLTRSENLNDIEGAAVAYTNVLKVLAHSCGVRLCPLFDPNAVAAAIEPPVMRTFPFCNKVGDLAA